MKGFTLIETLIAISVLSIAITGPFQIVQGVLQASYIARDQLIAAALAQEGVEYVRQIRDSNFIYNSKHGGGHTWLQGLDGTSGADCYYLTSGTSCVVDVGLQTVTACAGTTCAEKPLYLSASNLYTQVVSIGTTPFTRTVQLVKIDTTETLVTVTVSWQYHGVHTVVLAESLRNWL